MAHWNKETQPTRAIQSGRSSIRRLLIFLLVILIIIGAVAFGYVMGRHPQPLESIGASLSTLIESLRPAAVAPEIDPLPPAQHRSH